MGAALRGPSAGFFSPVHLPGAPGEPGEVPGGPEEVLQGDEFPPGVVVFGLPRHQKVFSSLLRSGPGQFEGS